MAGPGLSGKLVSGERVVTHFLPNYGERVGAVQSRDWGIIRFRLFHFPFFLSTLTAVLLRLSGLTSLEYTTKKEKRLAWHFR